MIRRLLVVILLTDEVAEPHLLWDQFKTGLCNNIKHKLHHMNHYQADQEIPKDDIYDYGLWDLNRILVGMGKSLANFLPIPLPQQQWAHRIPNPLLQAEQYNVDEMATLVDEQRAIFNPDQATAFNAILESVINNQGYLFFIHATGGCGKTFLCNTIAGEVRRRGQVALCVWHHLGLLLFCWIEKEHLIHASRFLFPFMKTLWLDSSAIVTSSQFSNKPRLLFGMKFLCSTSMILMLLINVSETCLK